MAGYTVLTTAAAWCSLNNRYLQIKDKSEAEEVSPTKGHFLFCTDFPPLAAEYQ